MAQADPLECILCALSTFLSRHAVVDLRQFDILEHGTMVQQMKRLEHEADTTATKPRPCVVTQGAGIDAVEQIAADRWSVEEPEQMQQGRFA